jgi:hypothetical protein
MTIFFLLFFSHFSYPSPHQGATLLLNIAIIEIISSYGMVDDSLVYRSSSSTEAVIQRTIEGIQRLIKIHNGPQGEGDEEEKEPVIQINPAMKKHWQSEIEILREAPRDEKRIREILKVKQKEYEKVENSEDIDRLVPEIEMLKFVLFLVCRNER